MSQTLIIELPEDTFQPLQDCAQERQQRPEEWVRDLLIQILETGRFGGYEQDLDDPRIVRNNTILSGEPILLGTRTPVRAIVELWRMGIAPEEIAQHLPHLTLGQIFAALSFYSDHQSEIQQYIERNRVPEEWIDPLVKDL